nr:tripeptide transporter permease [Raoultella sp. NCTC 9187]
MYYMSINIGSFFSMLATPWLAAKFGWSIAFSLSFVGMLITLVNFMFCKKWVKNYGSKPTSHRFITANCWRLSWAWLSW